MNKCGLFGNKNHRMASMKTEHSKLDQLVDTLKVFAECREHLLYHCLIKLCAFFGLNYSNWIVMLGKENVKFCTIYINPSVYSYLSKRKM